MGPMKPPWSGHTERFSLWNLPFKRGNHNGKGSEKLI